MPSYSISPALDQRVRDHVTKTGGSQTQVVEKALTAYFESLDVAKRFQKRTATKKTKR